MCREWSSRRSSEARRTVCAAVLFFALLAPSGAGADMDGTRLLSRYTRHSHLLRVSLPEDYDTSERTCDVLYLLDGDKYFDEVVALLRNGAGRGPGGDLIIVGIGYEKTANRRKRDYTPVKVPGFPTGGGVKKFYLFLRHELVPRIDRTYRTNAVRAGRCIAGHSLGGIAVCYGLMYHHDLFGRFIAISPSLWWGDGLFINRYRMDFSGITASSPLRYYSASGTLEDPSMDALARHYNRRVRRKGGERVVVAYSLLEGRGHDDIFPAALVEGLGFVFAQGVGAEPAGVPPQSVLLYMK
jgi:predicted alpha/beta superfamily hydrolase